MFDNFYLVNWNLFRNSRKTTGEFVDAISAIIPNIDDIDHEKILNFITNSNNTSFIFPITTVVECDINYKQFIKNLFIKLLNIDLKNNTIYIPFPGDSMYLKGDCNIQKQHNELVNLLWRNPKDNIKIIVPLRTLKHLRFSSNEKVGFHPLLTNYNHILLFPQWHYCYHLAKLQLNKNPINKILLTGAVGKLGYPDRFKFKKLVKKYPKYLAYYNKNSKQRQNQKYSDAKVYNITLNNYIGAFYSGVHQTEQHFLLLKFFEILGSGALLLLEKKSKINCDILGLVENKHYLTIDLQADETSIMNKIKFILNPKNKKYILNIRNNGRRFCHEHLDYRYSTQNFLNLLKNI